MKYLGFFSLVLFFMIACHSLEQPLELADIFTDNMVLQQKKPIPIWGTGPAGQSIEVQLADQKVKVKANQKGRWRVRLLAMPAGGPFELRVKTEKGKAITLRNILIGEVWLCSGQSNMEMPLKGWLPEAPVENSEQEIASAHLPQIRFFTVPRHMALQKETEIKSQWQVCSPQTAADFSATAFFFGKKLYQELGVPIGLIHSSWGGTPAEAWTAVDCLQKMDDFKDVAQKIQQMEPVLKQLKTWRQGLQKIEVPDINDSSFWAGLDVQDALYTDANLQDWYEAQLPGRWEESALGEFDGIVWYKKIVKVPQAWIGQDLILNLCPIDDMDRTYFNGQKVGGKEQMGFWQTPRQYVVPGQLVKETNVIAIRVIDTQGAGGLWGNYEKFDLQLKSDPAQRIELAGQWHYLPVAEYDNNVFYVYGPKQKDFEQRPRLPLQLSPHTPGVLFNGMIHPLIPFSIKGVIWYQGEANVSRPLQYRELFPLMINCWREKWQQGDFPFYYVQIAPYDYGAQSHSELLREAQWMAMKLKNTGMVVTTDIGDDHNIHPAKKREVGERLALWALAHDYGREDLVFSGPIFSRAESTGHRMRIYFQYADGGLILKRAVAENPFQIAGADRKFLPARVKVEQNTIIVWHPQIARPRAVRYGWSNTPHAVLFNQAGLPAAPFRTDDW